LFPFRALPQILDESGNLIKPLRLTIQRLKQGFQEWKSESRLVAVRMVILTISTESFNHSARGLFIVGKEHQYVLEKLLAIAEQSQQ
jgi:hypothetical protein